MDDTSEPLGLWDVLETLTPVLLATVPAPLISVVAGDHLAHVVPASLPVARESVRLIGTLLGAGVVLAASFAVCALARRFAVKLRRTA